MARRFPDRVAAIVDLMSHLFMLSVMLFVLAAPLRLQSAVTQRQLIHLNLGALRPDGSMLNLAVVGVPTEHANIEIDVRLDNGLELRDLPDSLQFLRRHPRDGRIEIEGYLSHFTAERAVILFTTFDDRLLLAPIDLSISVRGSRGSCNAITNIPLVLGRNPIYRFDLGTCRES